MKTGDATLLCGPAGLSANFGCMDMHAAACGMRRRLFFGFAQLGQDAFERGDDLRLLDL